MWLYVVKMKKQNSYPVVRRSEAKGEIYVREGRIIDSGQVFEFNFRNRNLHLVLVSRISNSIVYPLRQISPALVAGVYGNRAPSWIFQIKTNTWDFSLKSSNIYPSIILPCLCRKIYLSTFTLATLQSYQNSLFIMNVKNVVVRVIRNFNFECVVSYLYCT